MLELPSSGPCHTLSDIKHIIEAYLNNLAARSRKRIDHPRHLQLVFERCRFYKIWLNPNKCVFIVTFGRLLGFIVSTEGIQVDPFKIEVIIQLPPLSSIQQLQSLQGKANFLRRFIANYAEITKEFMRLLQKGVPFVWDHFSQQLFDALKKALVSAPFSSPLDYGRDFLLYLVDAESTIEFDLELLSAKSKKYLVFTELISELPCGEDIVYEESFPNEHLFFISSQDPWYGDIIVSLHTSKFPSSFSKDEHRKLRHLAKNYVIISNTLYRRGVDSILRHCLTLEEVKSMINDCHSGACGGRLSRLATAQHMLHASYFWPSLFKDHVEAVKRCHPCQVYTQKMHAHPAPLFPVVTVGPFTKWGIDFTTCNPPSAVNHKCIISVVDYFMKWAEAMPTYKNDTETVALFLFNQIISRFGIPRDIVTDHGSNF
eukprot:PITA_34066